VTVYINGSIEPKAKVLTVQQSIGGSQPDTAMLVIEKHGYRAANDLPDDLILQDGFALVDYFENKTCEITVATTSGTKVIHFGRIPGGDVQLWGDEIRFTSRFDDHMFGNPLEYAEEKLYPSSPVGKTVYVDMPHRFNPIVDGRCLPNMWLRTPKLKYSVIIDPESLPRNSFDAGLSAGVAIPELNFWTLTEISLYLMWSLNGAEAYVKNPSLKQVTAVLGANPDWIRDWKAETGKRLPELLDELLEPFGFYWRVKYNAVGSREIVFGKRSGGTKTSLRLQIVGASLDTDVSHVVDTRISIDHVHRATNQVICKGGYPEVETTVELRPAWPASYDEHFGKDLSLESAGVQSNPILGRVWRDWVLNEGGDYGEVRIKGEPFYDELKKPFDLSTLFGHPANTLRRRKFLPLLTQFDDRTPFGIWDGVFVEWWDGSYWRKVTELNHQAIQLLTTECGIRFSNSVSPPEELIAIGIDTVKVRITATIQGDLRIRGAFGPVGSALIDIRQQIVDVGDNYRWRAVHPTSIFYTDVKSGLKKAAEADDRNALQALTLQMYDAWNQSTVQGNAELEGVDYNMDWFSLAITGIQPRNIDLRATSKLIRKSKYPSPVAVMWDFQRQRTVLRLDTPRESRFE
jgi:hypothetical protein